ncbi:MAG: hypothetical protein A3E12_02580 [Candidatus Levybacteria bacterium RIFCSPHIGHO2_12_FULL_39_9]|nr:MAG: hypothetical protein A3E12_02580 [Candidatus Levybacteria bacterium RIFCSPHIGHO2_12_FULL_39_9]
MIRKKNIRTLVILLAILGLLMSYQLRKVPELSMDTLVTVLPPELENLSDTGIGPQLFEKQIKVPIFLYHYVEYVKNDPKKENFATPPNVLQAQIKTLKTAGYTFVAPDDLIKDLLGELVLPKKIIILSFDDGYSDFYTDVFPILKKEKVKAVVYVVANFLNQENYLSTFQVKEIAKSSLVEIGSHTLNHTWLKDINKKTAEYEIAQSKKVLEDMTGLSVNSFAYPYGALDRRTINMVKNAGYTNAVSTIPGIKQTIRNKFFLYRLRPGYKTGMELIKFLAQEDFKPW